MRAASRAIWTEPHMHTARFDRSFEASHGGLMRHPVLTSWCLLLYVDGLMLFANFRAIIRRVGKQEIRQVTKEHPQSPEEISSAMDMACVFYFKRVLCFQRSAALAILLRRQGWDSQMVIGVQILPFQSHAWVEVEGQVVNDKPYVCEIYRVLERC
jgi:hypothetical protein